jgi:ABC-type phosphate transport system substrate-binding protein
MKKLISIRNVIKWMWSLVCISVIVVFAPLGVANESIAIIVNSQNNQSLSQQDIKNIYDDIVTHWENGELITVLNLPAGSGNRELFSSKLFDSASWQMIAAESNRSINNTIRNPSMTRRERWVAKVVSENPNAIGYVPVSLVSKFENVRIIMQLE